MHTGLADAPHQIYKQPEALHEGVSTDATVDSQAVPLDKWPQQAPPAPYGLADLMSTNSNKGYKEHDDVRE